MDYGRGLRRIFWVLAAGWVFFSLWFVLAFSPNIRIFSVFDSLAALGFTGGPVLIGYAVFLVVVPWIVRSLKGKT
jgi:hypothetical protein